MSMQKSLAPLLLMLFHAIHAIAQLPSGNGVTLSGAVQDAQTKAPLAFLSIVLKTEKDSAFVAGALTDEAGSFTLSGLKKGNYRLEASYVGYQILRQRVVIGELSTFLDVGVLQMQEDAKALGLKTRNSLAKEIVQSGGNVLDFFSKRGAE